VINESEAGDNVFFYDPVFLPYGHDKTFAEMTDAEKNSISHRGVAIRKLVEHLGKPEILV